MFQVFDIIINRLFVKLNFFAKKTPEKIPALSVSRKKTNLFFSSISFIIYILQIFSLPAPISGRLNRIRQLQQFHCQSR